MSYERFQELLNKHGYNNTFLAAQEYAHEHAQNEIVALREEMDNLKEFYNNWYGVAEEYLQQKKRISELEAEKQTEDKTVGEEIELLNKYGFKGQAEISSGIKMLQEYYSQFKQVEQSKAVEFAEWLRSVELIKIIMEILTPTNQVIRLAMQIMAKDVRRPKCVLDGIIKLKKQITMEKTAIKDINENPKGLHQKYVIRKVIGIRREGWFDQERLITKPVSKNFEAFILRLDDECKDKIHLEASIKAVLYYAELIKDHLPELSKDLISRYSQRYLNQ